MRKIIIIIVIFLLYTATIFYMGSLFKNTNIEEELSATEQLLKAQKESPETIKATLEMIKIDRRSSRKNQLIFIGFGTVIGALLSFLATEISSWRQRKYSRIEKNEDQENEIIGSALKFLFKSNDVINNLWVDRELLEKAKKEFPEKQSFFEQQMLKRFDTNISNDFFNELNFHSFQLKRLNKQFVWGNFEKLMNKSQELTKALTDLKPLEECKPIDVEYKNLKKDFVEKCIEITKIEKNT